MELVFTCITVFTFTIVILMLCMHYNFGDLPSKSCIKLVSPSAQKDEILRVCHQFCSSVHLLSIDFLSEEPLKETIVLEIELFKGGTYNQLVNNLQGQLALDHISLLVGESDINA